MSIRIVPYEGPMAPQVAELFHRQWGVTRAAFLDRFARFYEHPYQRQRCLRVVALDADTVVGFAGFVVWPYTLAGRQYRSFQCSDVLLEASYRGRGTFQRMLDFVNEHSGSDFIVGFTNLAKTAFLRHGWKHILELQWYVKLLDPLAFLKGAEAFNEAPALRGDSPSHLRLTDDADFVEWRRGYSRDNRYFVHGPFELKPTRRRRVLRELIIGDVRSDDADFRSLAGNARRVTYLSIALNPLDPHVPHVAGAGFRRIDRTIAFIVQPFSCEELVSDPARWRLFRSDLDTW